MPITTKPADREEHVRRAASPARSSSLRATTPVISSHAAAAPSTSTGSPSPSLPTVCFQPDTLSSGSRPAMKVEITVVPNPLETTPFLVTSAGLAFVFPSAVLSNDQASFATPLPPRQSKENAFAPLILSFSGLAAIRVSHRSSCLSPTVSANPADPSSPKTSMPMPENRAGHLNDPNEDGSGLGDRLPAVLA